MALALTLAVLAPTPVPVSAAVQAAPPRTLRGAPLFRHYDSEVYRAPSTLYGIAFDRQGRLHAGSSDGVLQGDGGHWGTIRLPEGGVGMDVAQGRDGRVYVAASSGFGVIETDAQGYAKYRDLAEATVSGGTRPSLATQVVPARNGVYFRSANRLDFVGYDGAHARHWPLEADMRLLLSAGDELLIRIEGKGLHRFDGERWQPLPGADVFAHQALSGAIVDGDGLLLVGAGGLYRSDASGIALLPGDPGAPLRDVEPFVVRALADGSFVVGTRQGELLRFGPDHRLVARQALSTRAIGYLEVDPQGALWVVTEGNGLFRIAWPSPWSYLGVAEGLPGDGAVVAADVYDGALWMGTSTGVVRAWVDGAGHRHFEHSEWGDNGTMAMLATAAGLLLAPNAGLEVLDAGTAAPRVVVAANPDEQFREIVASRHHPDRVYALSTRALYLLRLQAGRWQVGERLPSEDTLLGWFAEAGPDEVWLGNMTAAVGPQRWRLDAASGRVVSRTTFGAADGLPPGPQISSVIVLDAIPYVLTNGAAYAFDGRRFHESRSGPFAVLDDLNRTRVASTSVGTFATDMRTLWLRPRGRADWVRAFPAGDPHPGYWRIRQDADGIVRIPVWNGLMQYDPGEVAVLPRAPRLTVDVATLRDDRGAERGIAGPVGDGPIEVAPGSQLSLRLLLVDFDGEVQYRHRWQAPGEPLPPWSGWTGPELELRPVGAGEHRLSVQARAADGRLTPALDLAYRVLPRWYELAWVRFALFAVILAALLLLGRELVRRRTRWLLERNRQLELRVLERTNALEAANRTLAQANEDLVASREEVIHSGRRADLIFRALNDALSGTVLDGHYRVEERIGFGGFGTVYRAVETHMEIVVAIKVFKPVPGHDEQRSMERFRAEGHYAFRVNHPNAVRVLDFGICLDAVAYMVMEFLSGCSLADHLARHRRLSPRTVVRILGPVARVLAHAHAVGVIHRDVKPNNVLLCREHGRDTVKLIDFGIAKILDETTPDEMKNLTATGLLVGTPNYMAPERFLEKEYDGQSDVYALGVIAYEMLAGQRPFAGGGDNYLPLAMQHVHEAPPPLPADVPGMPASLPGFVLQMLAKDPWDRPTAQDAAVYFSTLAVELHALDDDPLFDEAARMAGETTPSTLVVNPDGFDVNATTPGARAVDPG
jgi:serine/threonine protein kinase